MAEALGVEKKEEDEEQEEEGAKQLLSSYIGVSFSLFVALLPKNSLFLESQAKELRSRLMSAEEQLKLMKSRRKEDSKANARVVEIFASHRNAWQAEEKRLLQQIDAAAEEMANLRSKIEQLERDKLESHQKIRELEDMISFISRRGASEFDFEVQEEEEEHFAGAGHDGQNGNLGFSSTSKFWPEPEHDRASLWQV